MLPALLGDPAAASLGDRSALCAPADPGPGADLPADTWFARCAATLFQPAPPRFVAEQDRGTLDLAALTAPVEAGIVPWLRLADPVVFHDQAIATPAGVLEATLIGRPSASLGLHQAASGAWQQPPLAPYRIDRPVFMLNCHMPWVFGHWMHFSLLKVLLARDYLRGFDGIVAVDGHFTGHEEVFFAALGLDGVRRVRIKQPYTAPQLDYLHLDWWRHGWLNGHLAAMPLVEAVIERLLAPQPPPEAELVYMPRGQVGRRRLLNEAAVIGLLRAHGFHIAAPERMPMPELIRLIHGARVIIAPAGSAAQNILFARPGATYVEIMCDKGNEQRLFEHVYLAGVRRLDYVAALAVDIVNGAPAGAQYHNDFFFRLDTLAEILGRLGLRPRG